LAGLFAVIAATGLAQTAATPEPLRQGPAAQAHFAAASKIAGVDYDTAAKRLCMLRVGAPEGAAHPHRLAPVKLFDNLWYIGTDYVGTFAIKTSAGIILIDSMNNPEDAKTIVLPGLKQAGLDPAQLKYVLLSHGHFDHFGGAATIKAAVPSVRIGSSEADWNLMAKTPAGGVMKLEDVTFVIPAPPQKDYVITDGQTLTLGDETLTLLLTPGHSPGTVSFIVPVTDHGVKHTVAIWGGNAVPGPLAAQKQMRASLDHFKAAAVAAHVDAEVAIHPPYDNGPARRARAAARGPIWSVRRWRWPPR
jgi:metallo-beta-lactamase class B